MKTNETIAQIHPAREHLVPKGRVPSLATQDAPLPASPPCRPENADIHLLSLSVSENQGGGFPSALPAFPTPEVRALCGPQASAPQGSDLENIQAQWPRPGDQWVLRCLCVPTAPLTPPDLSFLTCKMETMRTCLYQSVFSHEQKQKDVCMQRCYKELTHTGMEADESQDPRLASHTPRETTG